MNNNITTNIIPGKTTIFCDMDGTLLDGSHDKWFINMVNTIGEENAIKTYRKVTNKDSLIINKGLLLTLYIAKAKGAKIVLWTNRGEAQRAMTEANLAGHMHLFSDSIYGAGEKNTKIEPDNNSIVVDNEAKNHVGATNVDIQFGTK